MFLGINQILHNAKKCKKQQKNNEDDDDDDDAANSITATTTTTNSTENENIASTILTNISPTKCKNCQHHLQKQQQQQNCLDTTNKTALSRVPCQCDCFCINKILCNNTTTTTTTNPGATSSIKTSSIHSEAITSLCAVYIYLGTLTLALATLSILFYSHVSSQPTRPIWLKTSTPPMPTTTTTTATTANLAFREQFQRELVASEHMLREIVLQILQQQGAGRQQEQQGQQQKQENNRYQWQSNANIGGHSISDHFTGMNAPLESAPPLLARTTRSNSKIATATEVETIQTTTKKGEEATRIQDDREDRDSIEEHIAQADDVFSEIVKNERKYNGNNDVARIVQRLRRDISSSPSSMHADPFIEFFNPNQRKVLEQQDGEIRKQTGLKGAAPGGDEWIYLNTYCRVPEKIITGFCKGTQDYCPPAPQGPPGQRGPPGQPGLPGIPGPKGNRGDVGLPGPQGLDGAPGPKGPRGPAGLDGRDGVPGEPGLDGVPGRAGADGVPGKNGLPGIDGKDGLNGKDGKDGLEGPKGAQGPPGERGLKGIAGPRGRPGKPGTNGIPGAPGVNTWMVQFANGSYSNDLLIPPSITDFTMPLLPRVVIVEEGKTLNLSCTATGNPLPHVEWRRDDGHTINIDGVELASVTGQYLKFTNITRDQMSAYTCFANNGIPPVANATYLIEVQFSPMISVYRQMIYAEYGHSATLECIVEAFPEPMRYWERAYDGKILDPGDKYRIESFPDGFKTIMRLTITNLRKDDFGYYHCVARNELNATMVNFEIAAQDPNSEMPYVGKEIKIYGQRPPEKECKVCDTCPDPTLFQCKDSIMNNFEIQPTGNFSYPGLPKRQKTCNLYAVGKPVFHKAVAENYGSWLRDPAANANDREKTFVTNENDSYNLYEYSSKTQYRTNGIPRAKYEIREGFHGNAHVVFNGSFYYHQKDTDLVVKLDLRTQKKISTQLPYAGVAAGNKLYSNDYNFMDFNVDEVGLWVIYSTYNSNNTLVAKLDADNLKIQYNFNITLDHHKFGEMFIVCGQLYAIDSCTEKNSQIRYYVDLYNGKLETTNLPFSNPFRKTTTVGYNPSSVELYSWDKGSALTYPIRYTDGPVNQI